MVKVVARTERVPAAKIECVSVPEVRPCACHHINDGAVIAAVLRREVVGDHAELFGRIRILRGDSAQSARNLRIIVVGAIQQEIVVALARSVSRNSAKSHPIASRPAPATQVDTDRAK